jgi:ubiquinone/menaquinone biosynthesis C-methylase UbiE
MTDNLSRISKELENYRKNLNVHDLPQIFHYWSNKYLTPLLVEAGIADIDDLYVKYMCESIQLCESPKPTFISLGSGNCDTEVRIAKQLRNKGIEHFTIECLELNSEMLQRGSNLANEEEVTDNLEFIETDINKWQADKKYVAAIANHSLHHIENLEDVFDQVFSSLDDSGAFITNDMIGRNGHQRWPEALTAVHRFWRELPKEYTYNHLLKRYEDVYENWDCSTESFEGIRAQDILTLLIQKFNFKIFIAFSNVIDIFIDRCFGHNFDPSRPWDTQFIDRVHAFDEESILQGTIKPTHMLVV